jgi:hypothetical protein
MQTHVLLEVLEDYDMDRRRFIMWRQGTLTDETGEPYPLKSVWWRTDYENNNPSLFGLLMRLTRLLVEQMR